MVSSDVEFCVVAPHCVFLLLDNRSSVYSCSSLYAASDAYEGFDYE